MAFSVFGWEAEMQEYRAYIMGPDGHVHKRVDLRCSDESEAIERAKQLVDGHDYGNWIDCSGRSNTRRRVSEIASHLPFARLDFRFGLKPELQVTACGATVLLPEFPSACFDLVLGTSCIQ
jgi:hypothetical protein